MMKKKRRRKRSKRGAIERLLRIIIWILAAIAATLALFLAGYYFGYLNAKEDSKQQLEQKEHQRQKALSKLQKSIEQKQSLNKRLEALLKKERRYDVTAAHETQEVDVLKPPIKKRQKRDTKHLAKLAIIFDDVSTATQVRAIRSLGLKVTMSFFPPSSAHPNTPKLAAKEHFYMIHLPMEALRFRKEEPYTLKSGDSTAQIDKRIAAIKKLFPKMRYINNHTGSKFTADRASMERLIAVLDRYGITFIDSRTTASTQVPFVMKKLHRRYIARDVFLDHKGDIASIKRQIALAVKTAKRYGSCIAIGHPHPNTIRALAESKKLLKSVKLVYVDDLFN